MKDTSTITCLVPRPGRFPTRQNTVIADVLARLLSGERMTGLEAVNGSSTTRLASAVCSIQTTHGWHISRSDVVVGCGDGRVTTISVYFLSPDAIERAAAAGAAAWCAKVRCARRALRAKAADAKRRAARANAGRRRQPHPGQYNLFDGGAA